MPVDLAWLWFVVMGRQPPLPIPRNPGGNAGANSVTEPLLPERSPAHAHRPFPHPSPSPETLTNGRVTEVSLPVLSATVAVCSVNRAGQHMACVMAESGRAPSGKLGACGRRSPKPVSFPKGGGLIEDPCYTLLQRTKESVLPSRPSRSVHLTLKWQ